MWCKYDKSKTKAYFLRSARERQDGNGVMAKAGQKQVFREEFESDGGAGSKPC